MKISFALSLLLASSVATRADNPNVNLRALQTCTPIDRDFGTSTTALTGNAGATSDGNFDVPSTGSFRCNLSCDNGVDSQLYIKFGTAGGSAGPSNNDGSDTNAGCNKELVVNNNNNVNGFSYTVTTNGGYSNLKLYCECYEEQNGGGGCFSGDNTVQVHGRDGILFKNMKDVQVGDRVMAVNNKYEPVYSFGHYHKTFLSDFVQIHTNTHTHTQTSGEQQPLEMTANHLVFVNGGSPVRADKVQVGDLISTGHVTKISKVQKEGIYMPLTPSGTILVNGVEASSYVSILDLAPGISNHWLLAPWLSEQFLSQLWLTPYRMVCMGVSPSLAFCQHYPQNVNGDKGIMTYLRWGKEVAEFSDRQNLVLQIMIGVPVFGTLLALNAIEQVCGGPSMAPLMVLLLVAAGLWNKQRKTADAAAAKSIKMP